MRKTLQSVERKAVAKCRRHTATRPVHIGPVHYSVAIVPLRVDLAPSGPLSRGCQPLIAQLEPRCPTDMAPSRGARLSTELPMEATM